MQIFLGITASVVNGDLLARHKVALSIKSDTVVSICNTDPRKRIGLFVVVDVLDFMPLHHKGVRIMGTMKQKSA